MPPAYIKPYVKRGKNDAVDAAAICEAMARPNMRFGPIKSADQQAVLMLHKTRELMVKQPTMSVNALRSHLAGFGLVAAKGIGRVDALIELADNDPSLPEEARLDDEAPDAPYRSSHAIDRRHGAQNRPGQRQPQVFEKSGFVRRNGGTRLASGAPPRRRASGGPPAA